MQKNILERLEDGDFDPAKEEMPNKAEYDAIARVFSDKQEQLIATFSGEQKKLYNECLSKYSDMHFWVETDYFFRGFRLGMQLMDENHFRKEQVYNMKTLTRILKYRLGVYDTPGRRKITETCVSITPISVAEQGGDLTIWAQVEQSADPLKNTEQSVDIMVVGTGHPISDDVLHNMGFLNTVVMASTPYVWHVYTGSAVQ